MRHRYVIERDECETMCDDPHPMRLGRVPKHYRGEPHERDEAIRYGRKGYRCPGSCVHWYPVWVVFDADDDGAANVGVYDVYQDAVRARDEARARSDG